MLEFLSVNNESNSGGFIYSINNSTLLKKKTNKNKPQTLCNDAGDVPDSIPRITWEEVSCF